MRHVRAMLALSVVALGGCERVPATGVPAFAMPEPLFARAGNPTPSASGHVEKDLWPGRPDGVFEKFSFSAHLAGDGSVAGQFVVSDVHYDGSTPTYRVEGSVICLSVEADGKTARMGGIITRSNVAKSPAGFYAIWVVQDNGEGSNAAADKATDLVYGNPWENWALRKGCGQSTTSGGFRGPPLPMYQGFWSDNLRANVQVKP